MFFFNDTATTEIYTLSLHDALPICWPSLEPGGTIRRPAGGVRYANGSMAWYPRQCVGARCGRDRPLVRSEEHTPELQSRQYLVCRLLLEKKKIVTYQLHRPTCPDPS